MKKKELFLAVLIIFSATPMYGAVLNQKRNTAIKSDIPTELPIDKKFIGPENIDMFHQMNPLADERKKDDYWDLAWHAKVADYGDKDSQFLMAQAYEFGKEVEPNPRKALAFYKKAAQQNHFESCMRLGQIYTERKWVEVDVDQALFWYKRAANLGYIPAQLKLSDLYISGQSPDLIQSYYWLAMATKQMFPNSIDLEEKSPRLKQLAEQMTQSEYAQAKGMLSQ